MNWERWDKIVVSYFKILSQNFHWDVENYETPQPGWQFSRQRMEPITFRIGNHSTGMLGSTFKRDKVPHCMRGWSSHLTSLFHPHPPHWSIAMTSILMLCCLVPYQWRIKITKLNVMKNPCRWCNLLVKNLHGLEYSAGTERSRSTNQAHLWRFS
jgi:hypothetical protein